MSGIEKVIIAVIVVLVVLIALQAFSGANGSTTFESGLMVRTLSDGTKCYTDMFADQSITNCVAGEKK